MQRTIFHGREVFKSCQPKIRAFSTATRLTKMSMLDSKEEEIRLKDEVSTVVIGGGISGTSLVYHLAKQGEKDVVLLERAELTSGSTWHAAGLTTLFNSGINLKKIHYYSMNLYSQLARETGQDIGFHQCGSIRLAFTTERLQEFKYQMSRARVHEAPQYLLNPEEVKKMVPLLDINNLKMGLYTPNDGHTDPYSLTQALAKGAKSYGAQIHQHTKVTALRLRSDDRWLVSTAKGDVIASKVVNAAGFYSKEVAQMAGYNIPTLANQHQYLVTASLPEIQQMHHEMPVLRHMEASAYIRQERDGLLIGIYEPLERLLSNDEWNIEAPKEFDKQLHPSDLDRMMPHLERAMEDMPCLSTMQIQTIVNGPILFAPDGLPLVGPEEIPNMWTLSGVNYGIIHGGGMGKYLADWMQKGEPTFDLIECDPTRFHGWVSDQFVIDKCRESYALMNTVVYPHEERFAGRPTKRVTSADDLHIKRGAHMQMHNGWEQPAWFAQPGQVPEYKPSFLRTNWHSNVEHEWNLVTSKSAIINLTSFAKIIIEGAESIDFIDAITANSVPRLRRTVISHLLTPNGKVYAELTITQTDPNRFLIITGSGSEVHDLRWLKERARHGKWKVEIRNVSEELGCLSVAGPKTKEVLGKLSSRFEEKFPFFSADKLMMNDIEVTAMKLSYTGELGWELYHPIASTGKLYEYLIEAGKQIGIGDFGSLCLNVLRLEKGFKMWGKEMNLDKNPIEADLMNFVNLGKGEFVGKEAVLKQSQTIPRCQLVMLKIGPNSEADPIGDEAIWAAGKPIGNTTSGAYSYQLQSPIAFAYVPPFLAKPGTNLQVELVGNMIDAEVLSRPPTFTYTARLKQK